jgi:hypothetical protein
VAKLEEALEMLLGQRPVALLHGEQRHRMNHVAVVRAALEEELELLAGRPELAPGHQQARQREPRLAGIGVRREVIAQDADPRAGFCSCCSWAAG